MPQALAQYPGVRQLESAVYTNHHGITPGVVSLTIAPQPNAVPLVGDVLFTIDNNPIFRLRDCRVDAASFNYSQGGLLVSLNIFDRRWRWTFGGISGQYNIRLDDGSIVGEGASDRNNAIIASERTPQELAALLLEAMGETFYDVSQLPNDVRPQAEWHYDNPAQLLAQLCEDLGCRIIYNPYRDRIEIARLGVGAPFPNGPLIDRQQNFDPAETPDAIIAVAGATRIQVDLELEAVGEDADGIQPIDNLSYTPVQAPGETGSGWSLADLGDLLELASEGETPTTDEGKQRLLAAKWIYRGYRIKTPFDLPFEVEGIGKTIENLAQVLPLDQTLVATTEIDGRKHEREPVVWGSYFMGNDGHYADGGANVSKGVIEQAKAWNEDLNKEYRVDRSFQIEHALGLVYFAEPIYLLVGTGVDQTTEPAFLKLRCTIILRDPATGAPLRYERPRRYGNQFRTQPRYIKRDDLSLNYLDGQPHNRDTVDAELDRLLDAAEQEYRLSDPGTARYSGLLPVALDGAIQSVSWTISSDGPFTIVQRNQDLGFGDSAAAYQSLRLAERRRGFEDVRRRTMPSAQRRMRRLLPDKR